MSSLRAFADHVRKLASQAVADIGSAVNNGAPPPFNSGANLPSPSYVNSQLPTNPALTGPTASAGDSYFVTGGYQGQLLARIQAIRSAAGDLNDIGTKLEQKGAGGLLGGKDASLLESAKNVKGVADAMMSLAQAIDKWTGDPNKETLEKGSNALEYVSKVIDAAEMVGAVKKLSVSLDDMEKKPNQASVEAWADDVGNAFDKAANIFSFIPTDGIPGFVVDYYKGLLSAPKNYINAFKTLMHAHYEAIDLEAGISHASKQAYNLGLAKTTWEGDLTGMFTKAYFQPVASDKTRLDDFMTAHRKTEGADLYKTNLDVGKALLLGAISREAPDDVKDAWTSFVGGF